MDSNTDGDLVRILMLLRLYSKKLIHENNFTRNRIFRIYFLSLLRITQTLMNISLNGISLIKSFEGFSARSYQDSAGIWTIGYGCTMYREGTKVKQGEMISESAANDLLLWHIDLKVHAINGLMQKVILNQNQFDALCSFVYNVGVGAFSGSTMIKVIRMNPNEPEIRNEFLRWNKAGGKEIEGLTNRRMKEADLYFSPIQKQQ
ncbi:MAG: lysozyme [Bacteroidetes bacterium]|nr:lysozyme [Bacteroidota bacterium]